MIKEVVAQLKKDMIGRSRELIERVIEEQDFSDFLDQDNVENLVAEKIAAQTKLSEEKIVEEVARILVDDDLMDTSSIENALGEKISERLRITHES